MVARISIVPLRSVNQTDSARTRLAIALALAAVVFVIEAAASIFANSLALLAEAFHVLIDLVALGIAFVAVWLAARPPTERRSFGLLRLEILATVLNTVLLLVHCLKDAESHCDTSSAAACHTPRLILGHGEFDDGLGALLLFRDENVDPCLGCPVGPGP